MSVMVVILRIWAERPWDCVAPGMLWSMEHRISAASVVPWVGNVPLEERAALAIDWITDRERDSGRRASVIVPQAITYQDPIERFKKGRPWASYRSSGKLSRGPVLVFSTGMEGLDRAARLAQDGAISYVAWGDDDWLPGWAAAVAAVDLLSGEAVAVPGPNVESLLDDLDFAGNNGWFDAPGKRDALRLLKELADIGTAPGFIIGAMLATGHTKDSLKHLRKLAG
jgi:hypothetical protein